ncbi:hypothetical protein BDM02DRAFT_3114397 [Thelephora ganbajun]|uniref:Uncharacterized protein n=1 Tax=Thelephora ganbajun TaxID=370292 RepID=A0ACB6ZHY5_THEGA|nr:hypothetical protein BDM02DRAFT_3114397 [Thelephora ganbajun]
MKSSAFDTYLPRLWSFVVAALVILRNELASYDGNPFTLKVRDSEAFVASRGSSVLWDEAVVARGSTRAREGNGNHVAWNRRTSEFFRLAQTTRRLVYERFSGYHTRNFGSSGRFFRQEREPCQTAFVGLGVQRLRGKDQSLQIPVIISPLPHNIIVLEISQRS